MRSNLRLLLVLIPLGVAVVLLLPAPGGRLKGALDAEIDAPDYRHASWSILVVNAATGETVYSRNPDAMLAPASVTKLFSCAAAMLVLGPDHRFETRVHASGTTAGGTLRGDLILVASGDPTLGGRTTKDGRIAFADKDHTYANAGPGDAGLGEGDPLAGLNALARQVKAAGIERIEGDVLVDDRLFTRAKGSGSGPGTLTPIVVNDNVIDVIVEPGESVGGPAKVRMRPETSFLQLTANVTTAAEGTWPELPVTADGANRIAVHGRIAKGSAPQVRIHSVEDPALFARALFIEALRRAGVKVDAPIKGPGNARLPERNTYDRLPKLASFTSPPLREAIAVTLKVSHNLYAGILPCLVAVSKGGSTAEEGLHVQEQVLRELGVDVNAVSFGGGGGGGSADHITARAAVQLLQGMSKRPVWPAYVESLPALGVEGSVVNAVRADSPIRGKAFAKSGTLVWQDMVNDRWMLKCKSLAGTLTTKRGTELHFAMIVNNVPLPKGVDESREEQLLGYLCEKLYELGP